MSRLLKEGSVMNASIVFGLFALYVASVSLYLVLSGRQDALLALLRRFWGRTIGHSFYFVANVGLPLLLCVLCLGWGVRQYDPTVALNAPDTPLQLDVESYRDLRMLIQKDQSQDSLEIVYGA